MAETFICERCGEECDDPSFAPLCPDCHWDEEGESHDDVWG
jgi:NMD protein affecting ribosome stability and mRNA decay